MMLDTVKKLLGSKKALVAVLSAVAFVLARWGINVPVEDLAGAMLPLWLYILGQGFADIGKEKAGIEASALQAMEAMRASADPTAGPKRKK